MKELDKFDFAIKKMIAKFGSQSKSKVIAAWAFKSSAGTTVYETQLHEDGILTCNCPGWVRHVKKLTNGETFRSCTHVRQKLYEASEIMKNESYRILEPTISSKKEERIGRLIEQEEDNV